MKDYLLDIVDHTVPLGVLESIRIDGTQTETKFLSISEKREVIVQATAKTPVVDFEGSFGIKNLKLLDTLFSIPEYKEPGSRTWIDQKTDNTVKVPTTLKFVNKDQDYTNDFRLVGQKMIENLVPMIQFNQPNWQISFEPSMASVQRLKYQSQSQENENNVTFQVENGNVHVNIGDVSGHSGTFIFQSNVDAAVKKTITVPVGVISTILGLDGDKLIYIDNAAMMIKVDSGLINYNYVIPALSK